MNHIEYYDQTINDMSVNFDIRYTVRAVHALDMNTARDLMATLNGYMKYKEQDLKCLTSENR